VQSANPSRSHKHLFTSKQMNKCMSRGWCACEGAANVHTRTCPGFDGASNLPALETRRGKIGMYTKHQLNQDKPNKHLHRECCHPRVHHMVEVIPYVKLCVCTASPIHLLVRSSRQMGRGKKIGKKLLALKKKRMVKKQSLDGLASFCLQKVR